MAKGQKNSLKFKVFFGFLGLLALVIMGAVYSFWGSQLIDQQAVDINNKQFPILQLTNQFSFKVEQLKYSLEKAVLEDDEELLDDAVSAGESALLLIDSMALIDQQPMIDSLKGVFTKYLQNSEKLVLDKINGESIDLSPMKETAGVFIWIQKIKQERSNSIEKNFLEIRNQAKNFLFISLISGISLFVFMMLFSRYVNKATGDIEKLSHDANEIKAGKLDHVVSVNRSDEIGELQGDLDSLRSEIKDHIDNLDAKVAEQTLEIRIGKKKVDELIDNMSQAVFKIDEDGLIVEPVSKHASNVFGKKISGTNLFDEVFNSIEKSSETYSKIESALLTVFGEGELQWDLSCDDFPDKVERITQKGEKQTIRINYSPIYNDEDELKEIMLICEDITFIERLAHEKSLREKEIEILQSLALIDEKELDQFFANSWNQICAIENLLLEMDKNETVWRECLGILHTIKGNSRVVHLEKLAEAVHTVETDFLSYSTYGMEHKDDLYATAMADLARIQSLLLENSMMADKYFSAGGGVYQNTIYKLIEELAQIERNLNIWGHAPNLRTAQEIINLWSRSRGRLIHIAQKIDPNFPLELVEFEFYNENTWPVISFEVREKFKKLIHKFLELIFDQYDLLNEDKYESVIDGFIQIINTGLSVSQSTDESIYSLKSIELKSFFQKKDLFFLELIWEESVVNKNDFLRRVTLSLQFFHLLIKWSFLNESELNLPCSFQQLLTFDESKWSPGSVIWQLQIRQSEWSGAFRKLKNVLIEAGLMEAYDFVRDLSQDELKAWQNYFNQEQSESEEIYFKNFVILLEGARLECPLFVKNYIHKTWWHFYSKGAQGKLHKTEVEVNRANFLQMSSYIESMVRKNPSNEIISQVNQMWGQLQYEDLAKMIEGYRYFLHELAQKLGKKIAFMHSGSQVSVSHKQLLVLRDSLGHLLRNAVDHGLEDMSERSIEGKNPIGELIIKYEVDNHFLILKIKDDGKGLDPLLLKEKAIANGLLKLEQELSETEAFNLIFESGFSTKSGETLNSGRGVGLDAVREDLKQIKGEVQVRSVKGKGTEFEIQIPLENHH